MKTSLKILLPCLMIITAIALLGFIGRPKANFKTMLGNLDLTNDLHHRIKAGLLLPDKEPICLILMGKDKEPLKPAPFEYLRISWEGSTFWVKADEQARVNVYMNKDTMFGHVKMAGSDKTLGVQRDFIETPIHPIKPDYVMGPFDPALGVDFKPEVSQ